MILLTLAHWQPFVHLHSRSHCLSLAVSWNRTMARTSRLEIDGARRRNYAEYWSLCLSGVSQLERGRGTVPELTISYFMYASPVVINLCKSCQSQEAQSEGTGRRAVWQTGPRPRLPSPLAPVDSRVPDFGVTPTHTSDICVC